MLFFLLNQNKNPPRLSGFLYFFEIDTYYIPAAVAVFKPADSLLTAAPKQ